jgi:hypothetical protein
VKAALLCRCQMRAHMAETTPNIRPDSAYPVLCAASEGGLQIKNPLMPCS